ncbi:MAG: hypothetical protein HYY40_07325 [Bacteroidetes bacterium]|nr:hypothetical protein [Bacteroidota bacterium]
MRFVQLLVCCMVIAPVLRAQTGMQPVDTENIEKAMDEIIFSNEFTFENHTDYALKIAYASYLNSPVDGDDIPQIKALLVLGKIKMLHAEYDSALVLLSKGMALFAQVKDPALEAEFSFETARLFRYMRDYDNSLKYYFKAATNFTTLDLKDDLALTNLGIAELYRKLGSYDKANEALAAVKKYIENNRPSDYVLAEYYNRMAAIHNEHSVTGSADSALRYTHLALQVSEKSGNKHLMAVSLNELGFIHEIRQFFPEAMKNYSTAEQLWDELKFYRYSVTAKINIARLFNKTGKYAESIEKTKEVIEIAGKYDWKDMLVPSYQELATGYENIGDSANALRYYKTYFNERLITIEEEKNRDLADVESHYQLTKKEQRIKHLENSNRKANRIIGFLSVLSFALGVVVIILIFVVRKKKNLQQEE